MKLSILLCIAICMFTGIANAAEAPVVDINPSANSLQQSQQRADFSQKEWQRAAQQVSVAERTVAEEERNVQRLTQQLDEAKRRLEVSKQGLERAKQKEGQSRAKWEQESSGLRQEVSRPKP